MEKAKIRLSAAIALIISVLTGLIVTFFCLPKSAVFAEETADGDSKYTTVTEDLNNIVDGFYKEDFPQKSDDYSLKLLTIAVNTSNELLVYVYQPAASKDYLATSINIDNDGYGAKNYELEFLSSDTVFFKYKVKDLEFVYSKFARSVQIISIFRKFINGVDKNDSGVSNGNSIIEVAYPVAYQFVVKNGVATECKEVEVITITEKFVGFLRYNDGSKTMFTGYDDCSVDSHFVAFSTDHRIDKLKWARVSFSWNEVTYKSQVKGAGIETSTTNGDIHKEIKDLRYTEVVQNKENGRNYDVYKFNRIQTAAEFKKSESVTDTEYIGLFPFAGERLTEELKNEIDKCQFVLRFFESKYTYTSSNITTKVEKKYSRVSGVTILTLEYEVNGVTFRRNCVDNKQSGSVNPVNPKPSKPTLPGKSVFDGLLKALRILLVVAAVIAVVYVIVKIIQANGGFVAVVSGVKNKFNNTKQKFGNKAANPQNKQQNGEKRMDNGNVQIVINTTERSKKNGNKKK